MTLADDLMLLAVHPTRRRVRGAERLPFALRAAETAELALGGRITLLGGRISVLDADQPAGDRRLRNTLATLAGTAPPPTLADWLRAAPRRLDNEYLSRLEDQKTVRVDRRRGRDGRTRADILSVDGGRHAAVLARVDAAARGLAHTETDRTLAALAHCAGLGPHLYGRLTGAAARRRLAALASGGAEETPADRAAVDEAVRLSRRALTDAVRVDSLRVAREVLNGLEGAYATGFGDPVGGGDTGFGGWSDGGAGSGHHHAP